MIISQQTKSFDLGTKQTGATLIVGLVFLLLLALVGMAAIDVTTVDVKVVANTKDRQLAFNSAESELFQAGRTIRQNDGAIEAVTVPQYRPGTFRASQTWWSNDANWPNVAAPGSTDYVIEEPNTYLNGPSDNRTGERGGTGNTTSGTQRNPVFLEYPVIAKAQGPGGAEVVLSMRYLKKVFRK